MNLQLRRSTGPAWCRNWRPNLYREPRMTSRLPISSAFGKSMPSSVTRCLPMGLQRSAATLATAVETSVGIASRLGCLGGYLRHRPGGVSLQRRHVVSCHSDQTCKPLTCVPRISPMILRTRAVIRTWCFPSTLARAGDRKALLGRWPSTPYLHGRDLFRPAGVGRARAAVDRAFARGQRRCRVACAGLTGVSSVRGTDCTSREAAGIPRYV